MIWIAVPIVVAWIWTVATLQRRSVADGIEAFAVAAILSGSTSAFLWSATTAPPRVWSMAKDRPELTVIVLVVMISALVLMFWLKLKSKPR